MSAPPRGATGNCSLLRAELITDTRMQATGPSDSDRPAYEQPMSHHMDDGAELCEGPDARTASGGTVLVQKFRNVSKARVTTLNVGTLSDRSFELAETLERKKIDLCAVQETRWSCSKSRDIGRGYNAVLCGSFKTTSSVGIIVSEQFRDAIASVERFNDRLMKVSLLDEKTAKVPSQDVIIVAGDLNGHVGAAKDGYGCHGGLGFGSRNADGERILEYAESHDLVNNRFRKRESHLISFYSGNSKTQIDFVLVRNRDQGLVADAKVVPYETVATQHRPLHYEDHTTNV
ncbi:unnamed protein product [Heligmosomoides polygyrus]|uniref:Endo/exonuclease/phosphatase domain-containing protein n=1 Tax=Heligmosomoides polygyrus TaxID=6339 RepID=A0A183F430_HELPZ|nr:unnamed protein product [Heligmosomoides polygyrus]